MRIRKERKKEYALYKGDELLGIGTRDELAKMLNIKPKTVMFYKMPAYIERMKKNSKKNNSWRILIEID